MEYGILIAEQSDGYQVIGAVDSMNDAWELIASYVKYGPDAEYLAPDRFVIVRRDHRGAYTIREVIEA